MEIVVNDTNILIDLYNARLLEYCKVLNVEFRTLDFIIRELKKKDQIDAIQELIKDGTLSVYSLSGEQMRKVYQKRVEYQRICNLSFEDISVMVYAQDNNIRLLTGDKVLRTKATFENVKVSGILYLTDMIMNTVNINRDEMIASLKRLLDSNPRLPKKLIKERIEILQNRQTTEL